MIDAIVAYFQNAFSSPVQIAGQIIGLIATLVGLLNYIFITRRRILIVKLIGDLLWLVSFTMCGALSGAATNGINAARETVFYFKTDAWKRKWWIPGIFMSIYFCSTFLTWDGYISLLPLMAVAFSVVALWATNPLHTKLLLCPCMLVWIVYALATHSVMACLSNIFSLISVLIGLWREFHVRRNKCNIS